MAPPRKLDLERAASLYAAHKSIAVVAEIAEVSFNTARDALIRAGVVLVSRSEAARAMWARPEHRASREASMRGRRYPGVASVPVPGWVPRDLHEDYRDNARLYGEIDAARIAREMKRVSA